MFKKITVGKSKSACRAIAAFTEDLERRDHAGVPKEHRATFGRGVTAPGFKAEVGEIRFHDDLVLVGLGSEEAVGTAQARRAAPDS